MFNFILNFCLIISTLLFFDLKSYDNSGMLNYINFEPIQNLIVKDTITINYDASKLTQYESSDYKYNQDTLLNEHEAKKLGINLLPGSDYNLVVENIKKDKSDLKNFYDNSSDKTLALDSVSEYFLLTFINEIVPYWYGTEWSMSGSTQIPNVGNVGCSYFVCNTLYAMGLNFDRRGVAQASSRNIARTFQMNENVDMIKWVSSQEVIQYFKEKYKEGLYIIGLDYHCAFLLYYKDEVFVVHSGKTATKVVIEYAELSKTMSSNRYYFGEITTNDSLMVKWLNNEYIPKIEIFEFNK